MQLLRKAVFILFLIALLQISSQPVFARAVLGISYSEDSEKSNSEKFRFATQMEEALGNLITVHNYSEKTTLLSMLTTFNKLDAALITQQTYKKQNPDKLTALAEVQVSGGTEPANLVLVSRTDISEAQQNQLIQGYQELILSTEGLDLLEQYATQPVNSDLRAVAQNAPAEIMSKGAEGESAVAEKGSFSSPPVTETNKQGLSENESVVIVEMPPAATPMSAEPQRPVEVTKTERSHQKTHIAPPEPILSEPETAIKTSAATAEKSQRWKAHVDLKGKLGNDSSLGEIEMFMPITQDFESMFFLDLRFQQNDDSSTEGNFGLGYRKILNSGWIAGGYGFYDLRESEEGNDFSQITIGVEALSEEYDARVNVYLADDKDYLIAKQESLDQIIYSDIYLIHQTGGATFETREKAMSGFDAEVGWLLPWLTQQEVRGYLGGYHFSASGVEDMTGPRARLEVRFPDFLGWSGSLFELGGEVLHDSVRDTDYFITARARIPFGATKQATKASHTGIRKRMTERIQRDPDIIVARQHKGSSSPVNNVILTSDGSPVTLTHVDSQRTAGDGSVEAPYHSLAAASSSTSKIVLLYADSVFNGEGITLSANQRLLGEAAGHTINTDQYGLIDLPKASSGTTAPIIQNVTGRAVELANGSEVSGIDITGATTGIYGSGIGGINLNRNNITNVEEGIVLDGLTPHVLTSNIHENIIDTVDYDGIYIYNADTTGSVSATITNNQLQNLGLSLDYGAGIVFENDGQELIVTASDNRIMGSYDEGILGLNLPTGTTFSATVARNQIENVTFDGIAFENAGDTINLYLQDNQTDGDVPGGLADYYISNLGTSFNLGATAGNPAIGSTDTDTDNGVIADEGNTRADQLSAPVVDALGPISIVDQATIPTP